MYHVHRFPLLGTGGKLILLLALTGCGESTSNAELRQYTSLTETLELLNQRDVRQARMAVASMLENVERNHWQPKDAEVLRVAKGIRDSTDQLIGHLHQLRQRVQAARDASDSTSAEPVEKVMLGRGATEGAADTLQRRLDAYARYIRQFVPDQGPIPPDLRQDVNIDEAFRSDLTNNWFKEFYFDSVPLASALATLAQQEAQVRSMEYNALLLQRQRLGTSCGFPFWRIGAVAVPETRTVQEGDTYRAVLFLTTGWFFRPTMQANGLPVSVGPDGVGRVTIKVPADAPAGPITWEGRIKVRYHGQDTTFLVRVPYTIRRR